MKSDFNWEDALGDLLDDKSNSSQKSEMYEQFRAFTEQLEKLMKAESEELEQIRQRASDFIDQYVTPMMPLPEEVKQHATDLATVIMVRAKPVSISMLDWRRELNAMMAAVFLFGVEVGSRGTR